MKQNLINKFKYNLKNIWDKRNNTPSGIENWDRNTLDIIDEEFILIRVVSENGKYYIKKWVSINVFDKYELTEREFNNLQKCYFNLK